MTTLHLVAAPAPPPPVPDSIAVVRSLDGGFLVQRTRHNGAAVASFSFTRSELEQLVREATAALEGQ